MTAIYLINSIAHCSDLGQIIIVGDLKSRCSDFIHSDTIPCVLLDQLNALVHYTRNESLPKRVSQDSKMNSFGVRLINMCM